MDKINKSKIKKIETLFYKKEGLIKNYIKRTGFKSPFLMLIKNNGTIEWYEEATKGYFQFQHSNGEERSILLKPEWQLSAPFLDNTSKGYICDENSAVPINVNKNGLDIEEYWGSLEKVFRDRKDWKTNVSETQFTKFIKALVPLAIVLIGGYILYKLMIDEPVNTTKIIYETAKPTLQNITKLG